MKQPVKQIKTRDDGSRYAAGLVFPVTCSECGKTTSTGSARAMREHADGLYAFICRRPTCKEAAQ